MILSALFKLAFASAPRLYLLTSHHIVTRRPVLQKVRHHTHVVLCLLVSIRFQVLFHSPPGVLFTFPSRYYTLSVTWSYLAFGDGPPSFRQDSSCLDVLWVPLSFNVFLNTGLLPSSAYLSRYVLLSRLLAMSWPVPLKYFYLRFRLFQFRSPLLSESIAFFLFLWVIRCFSSPGSLTHNYVFIMV